MKQRQHRVGRREGGVGKKMAASQLPREIRVLPVTACSSNDPLPLIILPDPNVPPVDVSILRKKRGRYQVCSAFVYRGNCLHSL